MREVQTAGSARARRLLRGGLRHEQRDGGTGGDQVHQQEAAPRQGRPAQERDRRHEESGPSEHHPHVRRAGQPRLPVPGDAAGARRRALRRDRGARELHGGGREGDHAAAADGGGLPARHRRGAPRPEAGEPAALRQDGGQQDHALGLRPQQDPGRGPHEDGRGDAGVCRARGPAAGAVQQGGGPLVARRHRVHPPVRVPALLRRGRHAAVRADQEGRVRVRIPLLGRDLADGQGLHRETSHSQPENADVLQRGAAASVDQVGQARLRPRELLRADEHDQNAQEVGKGRERRRHDSAHEGRHREDRR